MFARKIMAAALAVGAFTFAPVVQAEIKTYTGVGEYIMSDAETQDFAKEGAKMHATRAAQEKAGVFVSSNTKVKNHMVEADEIETFTAGIVKVIGEPQFEPVLIHGKDGKTYIKFVATVTVSIDTDDLNAQIDKWLSRGTQERANLVSQNKALQEIIDRQAKQIAQLENIIANSNSANIQSELQQIDRDALVAQKFQQGNEFYDQGKYNAAIRLYSEALQLNPNYANAYGNRGNSYIDLKNYDAAIADFNKAIEINPNDYRVYYNRGLDYAWLENFQQAVSDFTQAIEINPNFDIAYYDRGWVYYLLEKYDAAIADLNKAIEINPNFADAYNYRGIAYALLQKYDAAIANFNKAIEINPNFAKAYNNRGIAYALLQKYDAAIANFNKAIEINPNFAKAYNNRGIAYAELQKYDTAIADFTKVIEINPKDDAAYNNRGVCYEKFGETEKAVADFARAEELGYKN